jgi:hypothetical protein
MHTRPGAHFPIGAVALCVLVAQMRRGGSRAVCVLLCAKR